MIADFKLQILASGVLDAAREAGTMSMQQLLLAAIIAMGVALIYMHWDNKRTMANGILSAKNG